MGVWGRGYSDSVDLPHDSRLFTTAILLAITSSPLAWTPGGFSLLGYSLGGSIAADFASAFPDMVRSLVLLSPAGLIRPRHIGWQTRVLSSPLLPPWLVEWLVRRRLNMSAHPSVLKPADAETALDEALRGGQDQDFDSTPLSQTRPQVTVGSTVQWQVRCHEGYVRSFVSCMKYSSAERTADTLSAWRKLGLRKDKVMVFGGRSDPIISASECTYTEGKVPLPSILSVAASCPENIRGRQHPPPSTPP